MAPHSAGDDSVVLPRIPQSKGRIRADAIMWRRRAELRPERLKPHPVIRRADVHGAADQCEANRFIRVQPLEKSRVAIQMSAATCRAIMKAAGRDRNLSHAGPILLTGDRSHRGAGLLSGSSRLAWKGSRSSGIRWRILCARPDSASTNASRPCENWPALASAISASNRGDPKRAETLAGLNKADRTSPRS